MTDLLHRFRGLAIALAVLAISATVAFAAAPQARISSPTPLAEEASESPEATESAEPSESPEADESAEPSESPEATESAEPSESPEAVETESTEPKDTHGALVSTAARMPTPDGFVNHGAFVSCVAHLDVSVVGFDWATVTPAFCEAANPKAAEKAAKATEKAAQKDAKAAEKAAKAAGKSAEGKAKGAAARAAHGKPSR